jgi:hypothetical protein
VHGDAAMRFARPPRARPCRNRVMARRHVTPFGCPACSGRLLSRPGGPGAAGGQSSAAASNPSGAVGPRSLVDSTC